MAGQRQLMLQFIVERDLLTAPSAFNNKESMKYLIYREFMYSARLDSSLLFCFPGPDVWNSNITDHQSETYLLIP